MNSKYLRRVIGNLVISFLLFLFTATSLTAGTPAVHPSEFWTKGAGQSQGRSGRDKVIYDFTRVAFSNSLWLEDSGSPLAALAPFKNYLQHKSDPSSAERAWLQDFVLRKKGVPPHDRLVKWTTPITVGIGWPQLGSPIKSDVPAETLAFVSEEAKEAISTIGEAISQPIVFIPPTDPREQTEGFARIRIVLLPETGLRNHFKFLNYQDGMTSDDWYSQLNQSYVGAIPFTPQSATQVDGFLLPDADNHLALAVCRIVSGLPHEALKGLIKECLVRAMGLPESLPDQSSSILGDWNEAYAGSEMTPAKNGAKAIWHLGTSEQKRAYYGQLGNQAGGKSGEITSADKALLAALYCPSVRPGVDKYQAITALLTDNSCISRTIEKNDK